MSLHFGGIKNYFFELVGSISNVVVIADLDRSNISLGFARHHKDMLIFQLH